MRTDHHQVLLPAGGVFRDRDPAGVEQRGGQEPVGAGAASIPAVLMHFACMIDPAHALLFHLLPVLGVALLGALVARFALRS